MNFFIIGVVLRFAERFLRFRFRFFDGPQPSCHDVSSLVEVTLGQVSGVASHPKDIFSSRACRLGKGSENWIDFVRTPAPASAVRGNFYGGQWWLVPDNRTDVPKDAYSTAGNRGQYVIVVPSHDLVIVRRGLDYGRQGFNLWDLTREVLKAF